jgi:Mrp family chromosome partitioning ATPase
MERIKHALEKARQEREMTMGNAVPTRSTPANGAEPTSMGSITYTQTQSINVPRHFLRSQRIISGPDDGPLADTYNVLRTKVLQRIRDQGWRAIGVTSPRSGEGKTLTAINLAISLSMGVN